MGKVFVIDSSVIIDYWAVESRIMSLIAKHMGPVYVPEPILGEIDGFNHRDCASLQMEVIEPTLEDYAFAAAKPVSGPSKNDLICLHSAIRFKAVCITNDKPLRQICIDLNVDTMWGFRPMLHLVKMGKLDPREAVNIAQSIQKQNTQMAPSVVHRFENQLSKLGKLTGKVKGKRQKKRKK